MPIINVLLVADHLSYAGNMHGVGRLFSNTLPRFNKNKYNIVPCVLRKKDALNDLFTSQGIKIRYLGKTKFDPFTFMTLFKIIKEEKIDILHLHQYGASNFGRLAGFVAGVPVIIHSHDTDPNYPFYQRIADLILAHFTDKVIAVSESAKESTIKKRSIREDKVVVMHNAIPLEEFHELTPGQKEKERRSLGINPDHKIIGTVTRLRWEKGNKYLLEAASEVLKLFPKTVFLIVGDGPLREELQNLSKKLNIEENVIFYGFSRNAQRLYSIFDINVIASVTEGFSFALLEAMAMGKTVVATNVEGPKEILKDRETGLLVPAKDSRMLAQKIIYLLGNGQELKRLARNAKKESKKYDVDLYVKKLEKEYEDVLIKTKKSKSH
uniref:D-inositol-3-phosphate glycosyltransferase n=1 Tax=Candidatus Methanogaster sp. ANME-2c ERB4 TaxID=2759911 RepID=A0A7G9Y413_9EURY|nr:D-inositol-3-phosphate glycosyltransferase [Methanosarcinales archaeon ANME-2c ERB4]QNO42747.1 D-inositol-3-phosphate glycosyltransferase [Methanosarcinales archaeon ANME-2c ERB4]